MSAPAVIFQFQHKRGPKGSAPTLLDGELYVCTDTNEILSGLSSVNQTLPAAAIQTLRYVYSADSGNANAYTGSVTPSPAALTAGLEAFFLAAHSNTGASTLTWCSLATKNIHKQGATALASGDITIGQVVHCVYDGTQWQLVGGGGGGSTYTGIAPIVVSGTNISSNVFTGDLGSGGAQGDVPAPASGYGAAGKFLKADGTWALPGVPAGLGLYGEMTITANSTATSLTTQNTWYPVTAGWSLGDDFNGMTGNVSAGTLTCTGTTVEVAIATLYTFSFKIANASETYQVAVFKNGNLITEHEAEISVSTTDEIPAALSGLDEMENSDLFQIYARCTTRGTTSITITRANFNIFSTTGPQGPAGPTGGVSSVFGRTGAVVANAADYIGVTYSADTGNVNAYVVTLSPAIVAYAAGLEINFLATHANSGDSTLNVNGVGATHIRRFGAVLNSGDIGANQMVSVIHDGTYWQMQSDSGNLVLPLAVAQGGTGITSPAIVAGVSIAVSGSWPNQTVSSAIGVRSTVSPAATASVAAGGSLQGSFALAKTGYILTMTASDLCRLRLYSTQAGANADLSRALGVAAAWNVGLLFEIYINTASLETFQLQPAALIYNDDSPVTTEIYFSLNSYAAGAETFTFTFGVMTLMV